MKNLFNPTDSTEILNRLEQLHPDIKGHWGTMSPDQMLAHCSEALEVAAGKKFPPRIFIGRILGPIMKPSYTSKKPFPKNIQTDKSFVVATKRDFTIEKDRLVKLITEFSEGGVDKCTAHAHPFFGKLTPVQWSIGMYKHLDHHLRQFGV